MEKQRTSNGMYIMYGEGPKTLKPIDRETLEQTMRLGAVIVPLFGAAERVILDVAKTRQLLFRIRALE